ncbi:conserved hypothetical protein [Culex quinquefasciatus]|uniref:F-box domain-containing protein n=1 Tax=Culex quinquefasciatus TaxID=7176 RepID=B0W284_CULQU|nr:conserved hypothetical protein [Culex quinquefasciatus]|eukprot:XP_001842783.1 conserved hypothetical protein [Culex quinquefasciatus]
MPQDFINGLPAELLCQVFDRLGHQQQAEAAATCVRWSEILNGDRYVWRRRLYLCPLNLCENGIGDVEDMRRYRAFAIKDTLNTPERTDLRYFLNTLRRFLFCEKVRENVEDLRLRLFRYSLADLFANEGGLDFPKLRRISVHPSLFLNKRDLMKCNITAPNVREIVLDDSNSCANPLVQLFSEQITKLGVTFMDKVMFFAGIGSKPFVNLQCLTLKALHGSHFPRLFRDTDFTPTHMQLFRRLRFLKIDDGENVFFPAYECIFRVATNLKTLIVLGRDMSEDAFNAIDELKQLEELHLNIEIHKSWSIRKLSLPNLRKLTTYVGTLAPLESAPNLKSLQIQNHTQLRGRFMFGEEDKLAAYFKVFNAHLEELLLKKVELDTTFVNQICTLTKLRTLEMNSVESEQLGVQKILAALPQLKRVRFVKCNLVKELVISFNDTNQDAEREDLDEGFEDEENMNFFNKLMLQYPDCGIANEHSRVVRHSPRDQVTMYPSGYQVTMHHFWKVY